MTTDRPNLPPLGEPVAEYGHPIRDLITTEAQRIFEREMSARAIADYTPEMRARARLVREAIKAERNRLRTLGIDMESMAEQLRASLNGGR